VDDQLRGRAGRQGDPGESRMFVSLEDPLLEEQAVRDIIPARYLPEPRPEPLDNPAIASAIAHAQRVVEGRHFDARQALWSYTRLVEQQRRTVAEERRRILTGELRPGILADRVPEGYQRLCRALGDQAAGDVERRLTLHAIDAGWADHLATVAEVRDGIHLVAVGGLSPEREFTRAVARSFEQVSGSLADRVVEAFAELEATPGGIEAASAALGGPSATWTYLVHEDATADPLAAMMISQGHIGFAAAAAFTGPLIMLWAVRQRMRRR
jgi:preprotein translocase subunit SecA